MADRNIRGKQQASVAGIQRILPTGDLKPNPWNYNVQTPAVFKKLVAAIRRHGFTKPVVVRELAEGGWQIIDGEHRWRAGLALGMTHVPVVDLGTVPEGRAKELTIILNELHGEPNEARLSDLLRDIAKVEQVGELLEVMPFVKTELDAYLSTIDFGFTGLSEEDPMPDTRAPASTAQPAPTYRVDLVFSGADAREVQTLADALGMKPADAIAAALRHRAGKQES